MLGLGSDILLDAELCPVRAVLDYIAVRESHLKWSAADRKRQEKVLKSVQKLPSHLSGTIFGLNFPSLVGPRWV